MTRTGKIIWAVIGFIAGVIATQVILLCAWVGWL